MFCFSMNWNFCILFSQRFSLVAIPILVRVLGVTKEPWLILALQCCALFPRCWRGHGLAGILHHYLQFSRWIFSFVPTWATSSREVPPCSASQGLEIHLFRGYDSPLDKPQWDSIWNPWSALDSPCYLFCLWNHWTPLKVPFSNETYMFRLDFNCSHVRICLFCAA